MVIGDAVVLVRRLLWFY